MKWLYKVENYVIDTVRILLVFTGGITALAAIVLVLWAGFAALRSTDAEISEFLSAPTYMELRGRVLPVANQSLNDTTLYATANPQVSDSPFEARLRTVTETLDQQYNLAGREERKFSDSYSPQRLEALLIESDLKEFHSNDGVMDHYLESLQDFASDLSNDAVLSRIADTSARTSVILDAINEYHTEYLYGLDTSVHLALTKSSQAETTKTSLLVTLRWLLLFAASIFFTTCMVLVVFRIERNLRQRTEVTPS